jgi:hypothetical protein
MAAQMTVLRNEDQFVEMLAIIVRAIHDETDAKLAALEERLAELSFKGAWSEGTRYKKRNLVSMGGAVYICHAESTDGRPGVSPDWALLIAKAKDGRDGRDFVPEPPEQRTVRTAERSSQDTIVRRR